MSKLEHAAIILVIGTVVILFAGFLLGIWMLFNEVATVQEGLL